MAICKECKLRLPDASDQHYDVMVTDTMMWRFAESAMLLNHKQSVGELEGAGIGE